MSSTDAALSELGCRLTAKTGQKRLVQMPQTEKRLGPEQTNPYNPYKNKKNWNFVLYENFP
jgi:hypothetical protein